MDHMNYDKYKYATAYLDQFISYTSVWNLKFVYNLENPEVALLQIFHLTYIFDNEPESQFIKELQELTQLKARFIEMNRFKQEKVAERYEKMLQYIYIIILLLRKIQNNKVLYFLCKYSYKNLY